MVDNLRTVLDTFFFTVVEVPPDFSCCSKASICVTMSLKTGLTSKSALQQSVISFFNSSGHFLFNGGLSPP